MDIPYRIPGTTEPEIIVRRSALGNVSVLVNGQPAKRKGMTYQIPLADGTTTELRLGGQWSGLKATVNGVETQLEPPVNPIFTVLVFLPLALVVIGGAIGGALGLVAAGINLALSRRPLRTPIKLIVMIGTIVVAAAVWFGIAFTLAPVPKLALGTCVNGIREGAQLSPNSYKPVSCSAEHDNEIVGVVQYTGDGAYPGQTALVTFAQEPCVAAFATYVGIDFQSSVLDMIAVTPSDVTWGKGDRQIACVVIGPSGLPMTSSVRGSGH
jgi:Septum formation